MNQIQTDYGPITKIAYEEIMEAALIEIGHRPRNEFDWKRYAKLVQNRLKERQGRIR